MKLNIKKTSILFISLMIILNIVFSLFYISVHANHECHDEHCDICCTITSCKDIIHSLINKPQENTILAHIVLKSLVFILKKPKKVLFFLGFLIIFLYKIYLLSFIKNVYSYTNI